MGAPAIQFQCKILCTNCGKEIFNQTATSEEQAKEQFAKGLTASELHDCKGTPKGPQAAAAGS